MLLNDHNFRKLSTEVGFGQNGQKDIEGRKAQENSYGARKEITRGQARMMAIKRESLRKRPGH